MSNPPRHPDIETGSNDESATRVPGWLKSVGIALAIVALLVVALMLVGGGHTPPPH